MNATFGNPYMHTSEISKGHLVDCVFLMHTFLKNERRACDRLGLHSQATAISLLDLTAKSGAATNLKIW